MGRSRKKDRKVSRKGDQDLEDFLTRRIEEYGTRGIVTKKKDADLFHIDESRGCLFCLSFAFLGDQTPKTNQIDVEKFRAVRDGHVSKRADKNSDLTIEGIIKAVQNVGEPLRKEDQKLKEKQHKKKEHLLRQKLLEKQKRALKTKFENKFTTNKKQKQE